MIVYWYLFSNHYTRECIHTCERERTCGSSQSYTHTHAHGFGLPHMLPTYPPHPAWFPPKRGLACSATLHYTPVAVSRKGERSQKPI